MVKHRSRNQLDALIRVSGLLLAAELKAHYDDFVRSPLPDDLAKQADRLKEQEFGPEPRTPGAE